MSELTEEILSEMMRFMLFEEPRHNLKPTQLLVPPSMFKQARRIIFPHYILKRRKGVRGRAMALKWRRRMNQGGNT